jgi:predicted RNA-binding protein with PUA-like domain
MAYWLVKSEPSAWSWQQQENAKISPWDGVRNYQARNYMQQMQIGDLAFFYHSVEQKQIVGIVEVVKPYYPDSNDPKFGIVDVKAWKALPRPVALKEIKEHPLLKDLPLVRQQRLSVMPIDLKSWEIICQMAGFVPAAKDTKK